VFGSLRLRKRAAEAIRADIRVLRVTVDAIAHDQEVDADVATSRRWTYVWVGGILACLFTAASIGLVMVSLPASPVAPDPGQIGVVMPQDPDGTVQVYASFSGMVDSKAHFKLIVSVFPSVEAETSQTSVGVFLCGAIREGLVLRQVNTSEIPTIVPVKPDVLEFDTRLGYRSECDFVSVSSDTWQVALYGISNLASATTAGEKVVYAFPGVTTSTLEENVNGELMRPVLHDTSLQVEMTEVPSDLTVTASAPQITASGVLAWSFADIRGVNAPSEYRVSGILADRENSSQAFLFVAGALIGLAGAALLWAIEGIVEVVIAGRRTRAAAERA
jgi:hypothetical protein